MWSWLLCCRHNWLSCWVSHLYSRPQVASKILGWHKCLSAELRGTMHQQTFSWNYQLLLLAPLMNLSVMCQGISSHNVNTFSCRGKNLWESWLSVVVISRGPVWNTIQAWNPQMTSSALQELVNFDSLVRTCSLAYICLFTTVITVGSSRSFIFWY
jgi:hypothetical protein